jgi:hypothetical protein
MSTIESAVGQICRADARAPKAKKAAGITGAAIRALSCGANIPLSAVKAAGPATARPSGIRTREQLTAVVAQAVKSAVASALGAAR